MSLPFRSGAFDAAVSIAVMHHFSTAARRRRALREAARLLRPGGLLLIYAWAMEQSGESRRSFAHPDVLVPWHLSDNQRRPGSGADGGDARPPPSHGVRAWEKRATVFQRYCHVHRRGELEELVAAAGGLAVVDSWY
ncbi:unnamed protein product, partial [Phaeothamnion confervicola]